MIVQSTLHKLIFAAEIFVGCAFADSARAVMSRPEAADIHAFPDIFPDRPVIARTFSLVWISIFFLLQSHLIIFIFPAVQKLIDAGNHK